MFPISNHIGAFIQFGALRERWDIDVFDARFIHAFGKDFYRAFRFWLLISSAR